MPLLQTLDAHGTLTITISRPEAMNALNQEVLTDLSAILDKAIPDNAVKGIVLIGDGAKAFIAGADIKELSTLTQADAQALSEKGQRLFKRLEDCPKPVIAAVNGFALGGGCELAMACHLRIATENARFGQPEVNLGLLPGYGGTQRLTQLVGRGKALELMMTADMISAQEAKAIGLANHVVATREELVTLADNILQKIYTKSPVAIAHVVKSVNAGFAFEAHGYKTEAESFGACTTTEDFKEGTTAFIEKRKANFTGR
jgi:enoyl-CoA hydratase